MKSESGSALQKASFIVLLLILSCLAYLVMREFSRSEQRAAEARDAAASTAQTNRPIPNEVPVAAATKPAYAPLRPRPESNVVRVVTNRVPVVLRTNFPVLTATETLSVPAGINASGQASPAVPAALTLGITPGVPGAAVSGRATLRGIPPAEKVITLDAACGRLNTAPLTTRHFLVGAENGLANVFVYIKTGALKAGVQGSVPVLDNVNCEFQPYVLGVRAGQPFVIHNSDPVLHNAHALPQINRAGGFPMPNREFNLGLPASNMSVQRSFAQPEVLIKMKCDVHPWMFAYIGVVDHPWFGVTDRNGGFVLPLGLPAGKYTLAAVHQKAGELTQQITVTEGPVEPVSFTFDVPEALATNP